MNAPASASLSPHIPEDLIKKILEAAPASIEKMKAMFDIQDGPIDKGVDSLRKQGIIKRLEDPECDCSIMAADGGNVIERMSGADILLAAAIGVEGLQSVGRSGWSPQGNQYDQWQTIMPHDEATPRLCQGAMFLMELRVLAKSLHDIKIMDGSHFTPILKINSMLSAQHEYAGDQYVEALREFLGNTYNKVIPDIPDIILSALGDEKIIAIAKYSSSRDLLNGHVKDPAIKIDDKTFFTMGLERDEYTKPMSVGQSEEERRKIWNDLYIQCNLKIDQRSELNDRLKDAVAPIQTKRGKISQESALFFTYYKPFENSPAYRIECKKDLAQNAQKFNRMLAAVKRQIVYPDIQEPFPQYLADMMAKSVSGGLHALQDAMRLSFAPLVNEKNFNLLFSYRSR